MRLRAEQLADQLRQGLSPVYILFGDEQMLVEEAGDLIRTEVRQQGAIDRQVWHVDSRFKWSDWRWQEDTMSLFSNQRLLEVRLPSGKPGKEGAEVLRQYAANRPPDTILLIISGTIDKRSQKSKWFSDLDKLGVTIQVWSIDLAALPRWILQRLQQLGLHADLQMASLIAERVEGNLFAAAQEIDKLSLLCPSGHIDQQTILDSVADNARFEAFGLMDSVYLGHVEKIPRMISRLKSEGVEILAVFSAVSWSLHRMIGMAIELDQGTQLNQLLSSQTPNIWENKRPMMGKALLRHDRHTWQSFIVDMAQIDQAAKGSLQLCPWTQLTQLCLRIATMPS